MLKHALVALVICAAGWQWQTTGSTAGKTPSRADYARPQVTPFPDENPYSSAKDELGRTLFFDPQLSGNGEVSCSSCHQPGHGWSDGRPRAVGVAGTPLPLRSPTLLNLAWQSPLGWDGKFKSLESVAFAPLTAKANMNITEEELIARLKAQPKYVGLFARAFEGGEVSRINIELALATFERTIVSVEAPFDRWVKGDEDAISDSARRGFALFNAKAQCAGCHSGWSFTDGSFHDIGLAQTDDVGRGRYFENSTRLRYAFKTPTLREVAIRAPYMHDGSVPTLERVIDLYNTGGVDRPSRSARIKPLGLSQSEKDDLVAFLKSISAPSAAP